MKKLLATAFLLAAIGMTGTVEASAYEIGDHIFIGNYEQDGDTSNGAEPIEWRVIDKDDEGLVVISEYGLEAMAYHSERVYVTWEESTIRSWLNNEFYETAFSEQEKEKILDTYLINEGSYTNISGGNDTIDKIYLLNVQDAANLFGDVEEKIAHPTRQAYLNGCYSSDYVNMYMTKELAESWGKEEGSYVDEYCPEANCPWWLRNPGRTEDTKAIVVGMGRTEVAGDGVDMTYNAVRPVMRLSLDV